MSESRNPLTIEPESVPPTISVEESRRRRVQLVLSELDEVAAYLRLDEFFAREAQLFELMEVLGVHDEDLLEDFVAAGFTARTVAAIEMLPIVFVAWASDEVTDGESAAVISAIHESELAEFPRCWPVVQTWLDVGPDSRLWDLWARYMRVRLKSLPSRNREGRKRRLLAQAQRVARASGGFFGLGSICRGEQRVIDAIRHVFEASEQGDEFKSLDINGHDHPASNARFAVAR